MARLARLMAGMVIAWGLGLDPPAMAQNVDDADTLNAQVLKLYGEGRYAEAVPLAQRALALYEMVLGPGHPDVGTALNNLAEVYRLQGRYADAEPLYKRSLAIREMALGPDHPEVANSLTNLAVLYDSRGRHGEVELLYKRALAIREKSLGVEHPDVGATLSNLAELYRTQGRYGDAEPLYKRTVTIYEKVLGPDHTSVARSLNNLAALYENQDRYGEAELLYKRSLSIGEKALGPNHPDVGATLNNLAVVFLSQGRFAEAEPLFQRALAIWERAFGPDHRHIGAALNGLAELYRAQRRFSEAEPLYKRSLAIYEKALGSDHPDVGNCLNNLALLYSMQRRFGEVEPLYKRSLAIREKALGPDHPDVGTSLNNLAMLYNILGRTSEAEPLIKRSLSIREKAGGPNHLSVAVPLNNLAFLYHSQGRYAEAVPLYKRALSIAEKELGPSHPDVGSALSNLAHLSAEQGDAQTALNYQRRLTALRIRRGRGGGDRAEEEGGKRELVQAAHDFRFHVLVANMAGGDRAALVNETFEMAQWALQTTAGDALTQMSARLAAGAGALAAAVRERQDLVRQRQAVDERLNTAVGKGDVDRAEAARREIASLDAKLDTLDERLVREFPDYAQLARPQPLDVGAAQAALRDGEALVAFLEVTDFDKLPEEAYAWVVTRADARWVKLSLTPSQIAEHVATLRCGLDSTNWTDASRWSDATGDAEKRKAAQIARRERCKSLTGADVTDSAPPPFDVATAHNLYKGLFGDIEDLLKNPDGTGKQLLVVPSGPLTQLPFQVLITEPPGPRPLASDDRDWANTVAARGLAPPDYANAHWLIRRHAITVLPSVASLKALRRNAKANTAARPFVGFGNPLLVGRDGTDKRAFAMQSCPKDAPKLEPVVIAGWTLPETFVSLFRSGVADVAALKRQAPLPETADELCAVARDLGAGELDVNLGAHATETRIKQLNAEGALAQARVVHFATHGLIASEAERIAKSRAEPALLLTPPDTATENDDGLLTASEVTEMKLNADWVVLSACNTAAGGEKGDAEALSGLARAFFYAGAYALLVSHWYVDSQAAVKITTGAFAELKRDPAIGRAEALRRAMLATMADTSRPKTWTPATHPAVWAPFAVVGEGGAGR